MAATTRGYRGARADAEPTAGLPTLTPGRDVLPTRCGHCGARWLEQEPPLGPHQRGMLWCRICSRSLCWIAAPLAPRRPSRACPERPERACESNGAGTSPLRRALSDSVDVPAGTTSASRLVPRPGARRPIIAAGFACLPTCRLSCTSAYGHDALAHETAGADAVLASIAARASGDVATGPLLIQLGPGRVFVDGVEIALAPLEYSFLAYLAARLDQLCSPSEIVEAVMGTGWDVSGQDGPKLLRSYVNRLRARLRAARSLVETEPGRGYRLLDAPPC